MLKTYIEKFFSKKEKIKNKSLNREILDDKKSKSTNNEVNLNRSILTDNLILKNDISNRNEYLIDSLNTFYITLDLIQTQIEVENNKIKTKNVNLQDKVESIILKNKLKLRIHQIKQLSMSIYDYKRRKKDIKSAILISKQILQEQARKNKEFSSNYLKEIERMKENLLFKDIIINETYDNFAEYEKHLIILRDQFESVKTFSFHEFLKRNNSLSITKRRLLIETENIKAYSPNEKIDNSLIIEKYNELDKTLSNTLCSVYQKILKLNLYKFQLLSLKTKLKFERIDE